MVFPTFLHLLKTISKWKCLLGFLSLIVLIACGSGDRLHGDNPKENDTKDAKQNVCPAYTQSEIFRPRARQVILTPQDDWQKAIQTAQADTEFLLEDGTYNLTLYAIQVGDNITIRGRSGNRENVVIRGRGYAVGAEGLQVLGDNVTIADLSITEMRNHGVAIKGEFDVAAPHIYNVHFYNIGTQMLKGTLGAHDIPNGLVACSEMNYTPGRVRGDYIAAIDVMFTTHWVIRNNLIKNFTGDHSGCEIDSNCIYTAVHPAMLIWANSKGTVIELNVFINNNRNIALGLDRGFDGGIVRNNFIYRSEPGDAGIELRTATNTLVAHNTVFTENYRGAIEMSPGGGNRVINNFISAPVRIRDGAVFTEKGNLYDLAAGDLFDLDVGHLMNGSRAIGACTALTEVTLDIEGQSRTGHCDVGADFVE